MAVIGHGYGISETSHSCGRRIHHHVIERHSLCRLSSDVISVVKKLT